VLDEDAPGDLLIAGPGAALAEQVVKEMGMPWRTLNSKAPMPKKRKARKTTHWCGRPRLATPETWATPITASWWTLPATRLWRSYASSSFRGLGARTGGQPSRQLHPDWRPYSCGPDPGGGRPDALCSTGPLRADALETVGEFGVIVAILMLLSMLNQFPTFDRSLPYVDSAFEFSPASDCQHVVITLVVGLLAWLVLGLAASLYPDAWLLFQASSRRIWRRDALVAAALSLAPVRHCPGWMLPANVFHAYAPFPEIFLHGV